MHFGTGHHEGYGKFTHDRRQLTKTDHESSPLAFGSGELKIDLKKILNMSNAIEHCFQTHYNITIVQIMMRCCILWYLCFIMPHF